MLIPDQVNLAALVAVAVVRVAVRVVALVKTTATDGISASTAAALAGATATEPAAQNDQPAGAARTPVAAFAQFPAAPSVMTMLGSAVQVPVPVAVFVAIEMVLAYPGWVDAALAGCTMSPSDITIATSTAAVLNPRFFRLKTVLQDYPFV